MKSKTNALLHVLLIAVITNCTIQKRTHRSGYYIDWHKKSTNGVSERTAVKNDFTAANNNEINLPKKEESNFSSQPIVTCGDTLYLLNGIKIICKVIEISEESIKYKQCENIDGPIYSTSKKDALKIVYINGLSEQINSVTPDNKSVIKSISQASPCNDTLLFKEGKVMACEIVEVKSDYIKFKKCDSLNKAEYYVDKYKVKRFVNSAAIEQAKPQENYSNPNKPLAKTPAPSSVAAFISSLLSIVLFLAGLLSGGYLALIFSFIFFFLGIILGIIGLFQISNNKEIYNGTAFSILAFLLPVVTVLGSIFLVFVFFGM